MDDIDFIVLREALENSWDRRTAYLAVEDKANPARGQCYPTARVVQFFFPEMEIIKGKVWSGTELETHFWNGLTVNGILYHIDLTWRQFPVGSTVREFAILKSPNSLNDSRQTVERYELLKQRVLGYLKKRSNRS